MGFLRGANGELSSKRLWGTIYMAYALLMAAGDQFFGRAVTFDIWLAVVITGAALLGVGLVEYFAKLNIKGRPTGITAITPPPDPPPQDPPEGEQ